MKTLSPDGVPYTLQLNTDQVPQWQTALSVRRKDCGRGSFPSARQIRRAMAKHDKRKP